MNKLPKPNFENYTPRSRKGYFEASDLKECEENHIVCYVAKPQFTNSTANSIYFSDKFKYNPQDNTYTCPERYKLLYITKKADAAERKYAYYEACSKCLNKDKYSQRQEIIEHVFQTLKRIIKLQK